MAKRVSQSKIYVREPSDHDVAIESRVARIKARVAELTGNMDSPSSVSARR